LIGTGMRRTMESTAGSSRSNAVTARRDPHAIDRRCPGIRRPMGMSAVTRFVAVSILETRSVDS
jgi:hypothetical protein